MSKLEINPATLVAAVGGDIENLKASMTPGGIERQEANEQAAMIEKHRLPIDLKVHGKPYSLEERWALLEKHTGIKIIDKYDELFYNVSLPEGWKVVAAEGHSMWSYLHDPKGRVRAGIFYKGAFYDRRANWSLEHRYYVGDVYDTPNKQYAEGATRTSGVWDAATKTALWQASEFYDPTSRDWGLQDRLRAEADSWIDRTFPEFNDCFAYWD